MCALVTPNGLQSRARSNILGRFTRGDRFDSHGEERTQEQNSRAPKLSVGEPFVENPGGECHGHGGTNKLERLSQCDSDLLDRDVIQNVGKRNADDSRKDENQVRLWTRMNRRTDFAKHERKGQQQARSDEADNSKAADRSELSGGPFDQNTIEGPTKGRGESDK